jgi:hypothetical protein
MFINADLQLLPILFDECRREREVEINPRWVLWCIPVVLVLRRKRQEDPRVGGQPGI